MSQHKPSTVRAQTSPVEQLEALDPLVQIAKQIRALRDHQNYLEKEEFKLSDDRSSTAKESYLEGERLNAFHTEQALVEYATTIKARSPAGALVHLDILHHYVDAYAEFSEETEKFKYLVRRLIYSVIDVLEQDVPESVRAVTVTDRQLSPWIGHEAALEIIGRKSEAA
jgi:hypothetical protein